MKNLDLVQQENAAVMQAMQKALADNDQAAFATAWQQFAENIQQAVLKDARELIGCNDAAILAQRGVRQLTAEENTFYQAAISAMKDPSPKQALSNMDNVLPKTVMDQVFEDIKDNHPLLDMIDFQNTEALVDIITSSTSGVAAWGELTAAITSELAASFALQSLSKNKLSAFIPVGKSMLDMGPAWMDRYVRAVLAEALAYGLEVAVVDGDGDGKFLGMTRALTGATDGVYPRKTAVVITNLDPLTIGGILNTISQGPNSKRRAVPRLLMLVNPADYYTKIFPATTVRAADGTYNTNVMPYPTDIEMSVGVPEGNAVFGLARRYFAGMGNGAGKGGKLEYSDEYKFLEDNRVYLIKLYGNGRPLDANAFVLANISGLVPTVKQVYVTNADEFPVADVPAYPDARLASLTIGALTLTPAFNKSVFVYAASTTNATNTITALSKDGEATVAIEVNGSAHTNGAAATWQAGENTVEITVTKDGESETYVVTVTKTA